MIVVAHRRNALDALDATPPHLGVEVDVRESGGRLVVAHDPFSDGPALDAWLDRYRHRLLVVNTKEEGLVEHILPRLAVRGIEDFFFLGPPVPELLPHVEAGEARFSVRVSEVHHPGTALALASRVRWVWLDAFRDGFPISGEVARRLRAAGYRICLVSPELYGRAPAAITAYRAAAEATGVAFDAVCTRAWDAWGG